MHALYAVPHTCVCRPRVGCRDSCNVFKPPCLLCRRSPCTRREATQQEIHTYVHRMRVCGVGLVWGDGLEACAGCAFQAVPPGSLGTLGDRRRPGAPGCSNLRVQVQACPATPTAPPPEHCRLGPLPPLPSPFLLPQVKGWDVDQTIEKLLKNGTRISAEAHEIVRIPGLLTDADMIGAGAGGGGSVCEWRGAWRCAKLQARRVLVRGCWSCRQPLGCWQPTACSLASREPWRPHHSELAASLRTPCRRHGVGVGPRRGLLVAGREAGPAAHAGGWVHAVEGACEQLMSRHSATPNTPHAATCPPPPSPTPCAQGATCRGARCAH